MTITQSEFDSLFKNVANKISEDTKTQLNTILNSQRQVPIATSSNTNFVTENTPLLTPWSNDKGKQVQFDQESNLRELARMLEDRDLEAGQKAKEREAQAERTLGLVLNLVQLLVGVAVAAVTLAVVLGVILDVDYWQRLLYALSVTLLILAFFVIKDATINLLEIL